MSDTDPVIRVRNDVSVIEIRADVTAQTGPAIEEAYRQVSLSGATKMVLAFNQTSYINSGGIGALIAIVSESRKRGQVIRITGLSAHFQKIFGMVGLNKYAKVYPSEDAALKDF